MRSGDLFLEASSAKQATALMKLRKASSFRRFRGSSFYFELNFRAASFHQRIFSMCRLRNKREHAGQNVCDVRRITIRGWTGAEHKAPHPDL
ncbi:hypothetical protein TNCV_3789981 [Trichonephila clavipes]|nr:hypothetical protein TNCV_3789981 [Trichonephila clavipes]